MKRLGTFDNAPKKRDKKGWKKLEEEYYERIERMQLYSRIMKARGRFKW